jgi:uncharacterized protein (DUF1778 family)
MTDPHSVIEVPLTEAQERLLMIAANAENMSAEDWVLKVLRAELFPASQSPTTSLQNRI